MIVKNIFMLKLLMTKEFAFVKTNIINKIDRKYFDMY